MTAPPCVLDTSLASMILRKDSRVEFYTSDLQGRTQTISFQTVAEMREGALLAGWGEKRLADLEGFFRSFVIAAFADAVASEWARIRVEGKRNGQRLEVGDAWIAATAAVLGAPLLSHDLDFNAFSCPGVNLVQYDDAGNKIS